MELVRGEEHPLENTLIVSHIVEGAALEDLKELRRVSKTWGVESSKELQKSSKVSTGGAGRQLAQLVELLGNEESTWLETPFTRTFSLSGEPADNPDFWRLCGVHITRLSLIRVSFQSSGAFLRAVCESTPNLKELRLENTSFLEEPLEVAQVPLFSNTSLQTLSCDGRTAVEFKTHGLQIFDHFTALKVLNVVSEEAGISDGGDELISSLARARNLHPDALNLTHILLELNHFRDVSTALNLLLQCNLKLEGFGIRNFSEPLVPLPLSVISALRLIAENAESLRQLSIKCCSALVDVMVEHFDLGGHHQLEELQLNLFLDLKILRPFRNLRRLHLLYADLFEREDYNVKDNNLNLTQLSLGLSRLEQLHIFGRYFPNVKNLKLYIPHVEYGLHLLFQILFEVWPNLESLSLQNCPLGDADITGLDEADVERINRDGAASKWRAITVRKPNITSLTKLKSFVWTGCRRRPNYCAARDGVLELPKLKNLVVSLEGEMEHLDKWKEALNQFSNAKPAPTFGDPKNYLF